MAIPDYQALMPPLLELASDGQEHSIADAIVTLASGFTLTDEERRALLPSGSERRFDNRVRWARTYLTKAGLLETPSRGRFRITRLGTEVLERKPSLINNAFLEEFEGFRQFRGRSSNVGPEEPEVEAPEPSQTPEELMESTYMGLRRALADDLLERVISGTVEFFERLVVDLLVTMGYGGSRKDAGQAIGRTGDDGIDGVIKEDRLGLDVVYIQAKKWRDTTVGRPEVQAFVGSLEGNRARKGVFITTSRFSGTAIDYVNRIEKKIILIDGEQLAQLLIDYGLGVGEVTSYSIKKVDTDYFEEV